MKEVFITLEEYADLLQFRLTNLVNFKVNYESTLDNTLDYDLREQGSLIGYSKNIQDMIDKTESELIYVGKMLSKCGPKQQIVAFVQDYEEPSNEEDEKQK